MLSKWVTEQWIQLISKDKHWNLKVRCECWFISKQKQEKWSQLGSIQEFVAFGLRPTVGPTVGDQLTTDSPCLSYSSSLSPSQVLQYPPTRQHIDLTLFCWLPLSSRQRRLKLKACCRDAERCCSACFDYIMRHLNGWLFPLANNCRPRWSLSPILMRSRWRYSHLTRPPRRRLPNESARPGTW